MIPVVVAYFGQVVLWFGQAKYTLYFSEGTSELERKFLALCYLLRTTHLIFETFQIPFPTASLIFTAVKFHEVI